MAKILDNFSLENPIFTTYIFWSSILICKMLFMALLTVIQRVKNKAVASKEDSPKGIVRFSEDVERQRRAHLNDLENIPVFFINCLLYILTGPRSFIAINLIRLFSISRIMYTVFYAIFPTQPARALLFVTGLLTNLYMAFSSVLFFY